MKTSKKILLVTGGFIIVIMIIDMILLRNGVKSLELKAELKHKYKTVSVDNFDKLDFSSHWFVRINQGKECKVEMTAEEDSVLKPKLENINGTLYFKVDTTIKKENTVNIHVRIAMPSLLAIKAVKGTEIQMDNFQSDSLHVILENGCVFKGNNNNIKFVTMQTSGDNQLQFIKTY
jgi:hypothetical protein